MTVAIELEGSEDTVLVLAWLEVVEAMSFLTEIRARIYAPVRIAPLDVLGKKVTFRVARTHTPDAERCFHGVVFEAAAEDHAPTYTLTITARPRLARLELGRDSRIFQELSVPEVIEQVIAGAGLPAECVTSSLNATYEPQAYITQLGESDADFVHRLLFEEGIGYFVTHDLDEERVVLFDDDTAFEPTAYADPVPVQSDQSVDAITQLREVRRLRSDAVMLRDYDLTRPSTDMSTTSEAPSSTGREVYLHPGDFVETSRGERLAQVALERLQLDTHVYEGQGALPHFEPGRKFETANHARADLVGEMLLLSVTHSISRDDSTETSTLVSRFVAIPASVAYRPRVGPPAPVVGGTHVAFVTGAAGEELHGSERGQVKVRFPWDRSGVTDDTSSTWLRVGQLPIPGSMIVPRVGFEVLVDYELGDHDRPLVVGHLYNGEAMPPYELPGGATRSSIQTNTTGGSGGANELRFEDAGGGEQMFLNASHDYTCSVENDARSGVKANETSDIGANHTVSVTGSYNSTVSGARTLDVGANQKIGVGGDFSANDGADLTVTVGSRNEKCGGDWTEKVTGSYDITVGGLLCVTGIAGINRNIVGSSETEVGAAWALTTAASLAVTVGTSFTETVAALKMIKADTVAVSCGAGYIQNCASEAVKAGGNRTDTAAAIAVTAGGGLKIKAANINISGQTKVSMRIGGTTIDVLPSSVKIKSSAVNLKGVKKLESLSSHETK
ncbi:MAG: type VI secretion system tip protein VgrG [Sandaracinaceae bacterium]|nr:type VI secretion system tip protein VgrG [Sandaracinaceae bacterium]